MPIKKKKIHSIWKQPKEEEKEERKQIAYNKTEELNN